MRFRKGRTGVILVLGLGLALCLWASGDARAEAMYKSEFFDPFSGVYATLGEEAYAGCQVAADELNSGGIMGRKVVLCQEGRQVRCGDGSPSGQRHRSPR